MFHKFKGAIGFRLEQLNYQNILAYSGEMTKVTFSFLCLAQGAEKFPAVGVACGKC